MDLQIIIIGVLLAIILALNLTLYFLGKDYKKYIETLQKEIVDLNTVIYNYESGEYPKEDSYDNMTPEEIEAYYIAMFKERAEKKAEQDYQLEQLNQ